MLGFATAPLPRTSLVFKPQYLELATAVDPDATIYGLGEQELLRWSTPYKLHCNICMCCTVQSPRWCHTFFFPGSSLQYTAARRLLAYCHAILWPHQPPPGERVQRSGDLRLPRDGRRVTLWAADSPAFVPDTNLYGAHPFYLAVEPGG